MTTYTKNNLSAPSPARCCVKHDIAVLIVTHYQCEYVWGRETPEDIK